MTDALVALAAAAALIAAAAVCLLGRHLLVALAWLKLAGWLAKSAARHWRLLASAAAAAATLTTLLQPPLQAHAALAAPPSLLAGAATWSLLRGKKRRAAALGLLALTSAAAPHALQALAPLAAAAALAAAAPAAAALAASTLKNKTPREAFQAVYVTPGLKGTVAGAVKEKGETRVVMVATSNGETTKITISGSLRDEFEEKAGEAPADTVHTTRQVKKAWKHYLKKGDPQPAITLLMKLQTRSTQHAETHPHNKTPT